MIKKEFIEFIEDLGFNKTWSDNDNEYSIFPKGDQPGQPALLFGPKLYFNFSTENDKDHVRIYYSGVNSGGTFGSNIGSFPISRIGDFEQVALLIKLSEYFDEVPKEFKQFIREHNLKNILGD